MNVTKHLYQFTPPDRVTDEAEAEKKTTEMIAQKIFDELPVP